MSYGPREIRSASELERVLDRRDSEPRDVIRAGRPQAEPPDTPSTPSRTRACASPVSVRFYADELAEVDQAAAIRGQTRSGLIREAVLRVARTINARSR